MSNSFHHRSLNTIDKMMHSNILFDRDAGYNTGRDSNSMQRKNRMKRMEELSHSLDDGLNSPEDYSSSKRHSNNSTTAMRRNAIQPPYDIEDEDDYGDDEFMDDYYYNNSKSSFDGRPRSYNEKYSNSYMYDEYDNFARNRYSLNDSAAPKGNRYQQSPVSQQKYSSLRKPQPSPMSSKHILFNDEDDIHYMSDRMKNQKKPSSSSSSSATNTLKKDSTQRKEKETTTRKKNQSSSQSQDDTAVKLEKSSALQVMKAKLKIHNMSNDDSVINVRSSPMIKPTSFHRHHSVEAKLPSHHSDRSNMSPTIMEEIEFELQDVETEGEKELEEEAKRNDEDEPKSEPVLQVKEKETKKSGKGKEKEKKSGSVPSTPTTKKSLKAHLSNHKKLFKVPDIDLNNLKFPCFFSSHKNIAALKNKKNDVTSKSAEALNAIEIEPLSPPSKSSSKSSSSKTPPASPKKPLKSEESSNKNEKTNEKIEKPIEQEKFFPKNINKDGNNTNRENVEYFTDTENFSDAEFEVFIPKHSN